MFTILAKERPWKVVYEGEKKARMSRSGVCKGIVEGGFRRVLCGWERQYRGGGGRMRRCDGPLLCAGRPREAACYLVRALTQQRDMRAVTGHRIESK